MFTISAAKIPRLLLTNFFWPLQQLNQADISLLHKTELVERLTAIRKAFEKQKKDKETAANKAV